MFSWVMNSSNRMVDMLICICALTYQMLEQWVNAYVSMLIHIYSDSAFYVANSALSSANPHPCLIHSLITDCTYIADRFYNHTTTCIKNCS